MKSPTGASLYVSGKPDASNYLLDLMTQDLFGHLPVMISPNPGRVAVVGYGCGMTVGAVLSHPEVESVDVLEIEDAVIGASTYFEGINRKPLEDPRCRLIVEDGRIHLAYTGALYDVITSEPSNPWMVGVSNLFTTDFYREVRERLAPGGVFAQFVQAYDLSIDDYQGMLGTISDVFPHFVVFRSNPGDCILIASERPIATPWVRFQRRFEEPAVQASFRRIGITSPLELAFFLQGPEPAMRSFARATRARNTDDNVWLEYRMPRALVRTATPSPAEIPAVEVARLGAPERIRGILALLPGIPLEECVRRIVAYPQSYEAVRLPDRVFSDPWVDTRRILLDGLVAELSRMGRADLAARSAAWDREAESARMTRIRVTNDIVEASNRGAEVGADLLERCAAEAPDLPIVNVYLGVARESRGDLAGAELYYRKVLDHEPSEMYADATLGLARIARARRDYGGAIGFCDLAAARSPFLPSVYTLAARIHLEKGNRDGARRVLDRGLRFDPGSPEITEAAQALERAGVDGR